MEDNIEEKVGKKPIKVSPNNSSGRTPIKVERIDIEKGENEMIGDLNTPLQTREGHGS